MKTVVLVLMFLGTSAQRFNFVPPSLTVAQTTQGANVATTAQAAAPTAAATGPAATGPAGVGGSTSMPMTTAIMTPTRNSSGQCPAGFRPDDVGGCRDIDECLMPLIRCGIFSQCTNTFGSYMCGCLNGFTKDKNGNCVDFDECSITDPNRRVCSANEDCWNIIGRYYCICKPLYIRMPNEGCKKIGGGMREALEDGESGSDVNMQPEVAPNAAFNP